MQQSSVPILITYRLFLVGHRSNSASRNCSNVRGTNGSELTNLCTTRAVEILTGPGYHLFLFVSVSGLSCSQAGGTGLLACVSSQLEAPSRHWNRLSFSPKFSDLDIWLWLRHQLCHQWKFCVLILKDAPCWLRLVQLSVPKWNWEISFQGMKVKQGKKDLRVIPKHRWRLSGSACQTQIRNFWNVCLSLFLCSYSVCSYTCMGWHQSQQNVEQHLLHRCCDQLHMYSSSRGTHQQWWLSHFYVQRQRTVDPSNHLLW